MITRTAVIRTMKAMKKGIRYFPCGNAPPRKSITGKCQSPHKIPRSKPDRIKLFFKRSFGKAKPVHPISSKKPAGMAYKMPVRAKFGVNESDTQFFKNKRTIKIKQGGSNNIKAYHLTGTFHIAIRESIFRTPCFPSLIRVKIILAEGGPKSITGNIRIPSSLGMGIPFISFDATKIKAPVHEIKNVRIK